MSSFSCGICSETAGRSLEDMDVIFALAYIEGVSPVTVSLRKDIPPAGSPEAKIILGSDDSMIESISKDPSPESKEKV